MKKLAGRDFEDLLQVFCHTPAMHLLTLVAAVLDTRL